jgi:PAS domain S-box-containing protein
MTTPIRIDAEPAARAAIRARLAAGLYESEGEPACTVIVGAPPDPARIASLRRPATPVVVVTVGPTSRAQLREIFRAGATEILAFEDLTTKRLEAAISSAIDRQDAAADSTGYRALLARVERCEADALRAERFAMRVVDALLPFVAVLDASGHVLHVNAAPLVLGGLRMQDVRGVPFWDCFWWTWSEVERQRLRDACARAATGEAVRYDAVVRLADDGRMTIDFQIAPLFGEDGRVTHLLPSAIDISAREQAEAALRESESRLRLAVSAASLGVFEWRAGSDQARWENERMFEIFGCSPEDGPLDTRTFFDESLFPEDRELFERSFEQASRSGQVLHIQYRIRRLSDGAPRWVETWARFERGIDGEPQRLVGVMADVTDRVLVERASRENEIRFRTLADNIAQLAWIADETGSLVWVNRRWTEYTGLALEEVKGSGWQAVPHPEYRERVVEKLNHHFQTGEPWEDTFPMRSAAGEYRWFLSRALPIRDCDGKIVWWFGTNTDVTEQRKVAEALREADRRKDEFIAILAHELRNPLAPVRNAVDILRRVGASDQKLARIYDIVDRQVTHMARLIDDLLDVSRIQRGQLVLRTEPCDLAGVVGQTAEDYRSSFEAAGLGLEVTIPAEPVWIMGDSVRLAQMVGNLLQNAVRFTEAGGARVRVEQDSARRAAVVTVTDTGIGMDRALLERLFDPFAQAEQGLARQKGGLGLGLTLTRGLAQLHGGSIVATSPGSGCGSTFTFRVPLLTERADDVRPSDRGGR